MINVYDVLSELKQLISDNLSDFKTIKIGVEAGISANDAPFLRIVPDELYFDKDNDLCLDVHILIGTLALKDLEQTYALHHNLEQKVVELLDNSLVSNALMLLKSSVYDRDEVENFKATLLQFTLKGLM